MFSGGQTVVTDALLPEVQFLDDHQSAVNAQQAVSPAILTAGTAMASGRLARYKKTSAAFALSTFGGSMSCSPPKKPVARAYKMAAPKEASKAKKDRRRVPEYVREEMKEAEEEKNAPKRKRGFGFSQPARSLKDEDMY
jgi:hypothetical protein